MTKDIKDQVSERVSPQVDGCRWYYYLVNNCDADTDMSTQCIRGGGGVVGERRPVQEQGLGPVWVRGGLFKTRG